MEDLIPILVVLGIILALITLVGHLIWVALAAIFRLITRTEPPVSAPSIITAPPEPKTPDCPNCGSGLSVQLKFCGVCGARRPTLQQAEQIRELEITLRQLQRLHQSGTLSEAEFSALKTKIESEREQILFPQGRPQAQEQPRHVRPETVSPKPTAPPPVAGPQPPPSITNEAPGARAPEAEPAAPGAWKKDSDYVPPRAPAPPSPPRRPFAEVVAAFMEQSNIRWGEIIGGLLIIGCSTALVVSLWAQISRVPTVKFLIFTTVTAALFGIGFYTEHHWKLPTTSRGILTIATLLVPLNFLAIAAVSSSTAPSGVGVFVGEIIAPAIFLCLIYFAGRVITPDWPHLLAAGALGSSVGQLLIRHLAGVDNSTALLTFLAAFPVVFYVAACAWMLKLALADGEIDGDEATEIFITLGALTFAAVLPFALLLYKVESSAVAVMQIAPVITLGGAPMLGTGILLWQRARRKELVVTRTAGASVAILGGVVALAGMVLAWPNPASIVPAALINFGLFMAIALFLDEPRAHILGASCLTLAYLLTAHVVLGRVPWRSLQPEPLLQAILAAVSGQAMVIPFISFVLAYDWFRKKSKPRDAFSYLLVACLVAFASLIFLAIFGLGPQSDPYHVSAIAALFAIGAFWFAWREKIIGFAWAGSFLLLLASTQACYSLLALRFPWEASILLFAAITTLAALTVRRFANSDIEILLKPLRQSAIVGGAAAAFALFVTVSAYEFEPASLLALHAFALAAVLFGLLILTRAPLAFIGFQVALVVGAVLTTKSILQRFDWYAFRPDASLHPWALQTQFAVLGLICLAWIALRLVARKRFGPDESQPERSWFARIILDLPFAFDHVLAGLLVFGFLALVVFGAANGISKELTNSGRAPWVFNLAGFPHELIFSLGSLIVLAILLAVMLANLRERKLRIFGVGAVMVLWAACPLIAGRFESQFATASALRFSLAIFLLGASVAFAFRIKFAATKSWGDLVLVRALVLVLTLVPLILLTLLPVIDDVNYLPARGPESGIFYWMGKVLLYGLPLILAVLALALHAVRERSPSFAFGAGLLVNFTSTCVFIVSVAANGGPMNRIVLIDALQLNAIAAAAVGLAWISTRNWWMRSELPDQTERVLLMCQKFFAIGFVVLFIAPTCLRLIAMPNQVGAGTFAAGRFEGWLALVLVAAVAIAYDKLFARPVSVAFVSASLLGAGSLLAFKVAPLGVAQWVGLHVLLAALILIPWILVLLRDLPRFINAEKPNLFARAWRQTGLILPDSWQVDTTVFATLIGAITVFVALRASLSDPQGAWWSIAALLSVCILSASLNWITLQRVYLYAAGILLNVALSVWLLRYRGHEIGNLGTFIKANIIALSLGGIVWLLLELRARRLQPPDNTAASFHNLAAFWSLLSISALVALALFTDLLGFHRTPEVWLDWISLFSVVALMLACLWDWHAGYSVAGLYLLGLMAAGTFLDHLQLTPSRLLWSLMMAAAMYLLAVAVLWRARRPLLAWASGLRIPIRIDPSLSELKWLTAGNCIIVAAIVVLAFWSDRVFPEWSLRAGGGLAVIIQALMFALIAEGLSRLRWQRAAVTMFMLGLILFGWSLLTPGAGASWLNRAVIVMSLMLVTVAAFGVGLDRFVEREPNWSKAVRECVPAMVVAAIFSLLFVLGSEVYYQVVFGSVQVSFLALAAVALTLVAGVVICIFFAVSPKHDPLTLAEKWRGSYVYAAEIMLVLLFMHIRLTMPYLFSGFFQRYWPLVILAIAYAGIAISEFLRRREITVLAQPVERTGAFLPLLPVIGFWMAQSNVEYSTLLFVVGGLYGLLSILRRSFFFGLAAALAGNGGLWYMLHETSEYHFLQHPQLWLIPAAISVLIAAHLNRKDFSPSQMTSIRYLCLATIYVSSTADIFINGVARSPWLPLVLAALSIAGVFAGIIFRIQAFLLLGSTFLLLAVATMINYASVNFHWTWLWYVAGIVAGAAIITTFAVFEKKRAEVLRVVDELKDWKG